MRGDEDRGNTEKEQEDEQGEYKNEDERRRGCGEALKRKK